MTLAPCTSHIPQHTFGKGWSCAKCGVPVTPEGKPTTYTAQHYMRSVMEAHSAAADVVALAADAVIDAAVAAYENANTHTGYTDEERPGARSGIRDVMVRLGLYDRFVAEVRALKESGT